MPANPRKLYRSRTDRVLFGVAGGLGKYFEIDSNLVRFAFIILIFADGIGIILYLLLAIIIPNDRNELPAKSVSLERRAARLAEELAERSPWMRTRSNVFGMLLIVLGFLLFAGQVFPIYQIPWEIIWPLVLVFLGVYFIFRQR